MPDNKVIVQFKHVGPALYVIDSNNIETFDYPSSLAPAEFKPVFTVD